jgi:Ca2+-binding RTX toxin-like protein
MWGGVYSTAGNSLVGGSGSDVLVAGLGADTFTGGAGHNAFIFISSILGNVTQTDVITDFLASSNNALVLSGGISTVSASVTGSGSSAFTTLTLSDNTKITFLGVSSASQLTGHIFSN